MAKQYWVYLLTSHSRRLYVGVTNDLVRQLAEHRSGEGSAFTKRYNVHRLVYFEEHPDVRDAIRREKEIKGWRREKKLQLIERHNAGWIDLAPSSGDA